MDAALGAPEKMAENEDELTPMMSQYFELCREYDDSLVLFQVGDFYETFCEAAEKTARLLEIALTQREDSTGTYPMAGIPIDNAESYIETLLDAGYRVAVADQVQDPEETTTVVDRAVTRIVTPGTLTEDELLDTDDNNFVACLTEDYERYGLALLDVSTGDFYATSARRTGAIADEVSRFAPAEAIVEPGAADETATECFDADCLVSPYDAAAFESEAARERVESYFGSPDALLAADAEIRACGALLAYAEYTRGGAEGDETESGGERGSLDYLNHLTRYEPREYMLLDRVAVSSLELFERRTVHGDADVTLLGVLDETSCALGSRTLKDWLRRPLLESDRIEARLDAVEEWTHDVRTREEARDLLREVYDIERLIARISRGRANARDLRSLKATLDVVPELKTAIADFESERLVELRDQLDELADVRDLIARAIREDPAREITEGDVIERGYDDELDELRETEREGKAWIDDLEATERERTGIDSLKVGHNSVHGYYIEVTNPNLDSVPDDYERRQTLKNSERFYTPELKEREDEILRAENRADDLEHELFRDVRSTVAAESERVQAVADALAQLDVLAALGEVAATRDYARPDIGGDGIHVEGGRHPVVERTQDSFVPNDAHLDSDDTFAVVTGPNMSGKSTYMRQVALITVLAQTGSFVPAASARIAPVDRIFTRVGASDDIAGGRSTFMVEMTELAAILESATDESLVLLDEVGRGTSTTDGLAIARAVTEHVHDEVGALTLFATHHHELTETADDLPRAFNLHFAAEGTDDEVVFDHEVRRGAATASYGVQVAREAGVPDEVVGRARELLAEAESADVEVDADIDDGASDPPEPAPKAIADGAADELAERLREVDVATMTPLEAMNELAELKRDVE
ncbi:DNA mismatch repair protein MutS [Halorussus gelatinilyticus]|uniref:DNA mismatch repair protein MutS n=1 Tax=Halorussus gelatinilyticus TaxID=2937524 RepID=A0A8U0ICT2_9EURY|nr:DNA mismatch repair protein MutS [Halorussus gelatinilyticus]UPV98849.1 DNA mismatch repair protein MutS [Halorussus gelatinilyticus]